MTSTMDEFYCTDCNKYFESASFLLRHFALHANQEDNLEETNENFKHKKENNSHEVTEISSFFCLKSYKKNVPDLYPISMVKSKINKLENNHFCDKESNNIFIETEDFNPLKYCSISMEVKEHNNTAQKKKYPCTFCTKVFGWSTDLKRHILTHTGQRPFKCKFCNATFTRNFLLQKHETRIHQNKIDTKNKLKMPNLNPISTKDAINKLKDSRKQDKQKIKRKCFVSNEFYGIRPQFNHNDKETIVQ